MMVFFVLIVCLPPSISSTSIVLASVKLKKNKIQTKCNQLKTGNLTVFRSVILKISRARAENQNHKCHAETLSEEGMHACIAACLINLISSLISHSGRSAGVQVADNTKQAQKKSYGSKQERAVNYAPAVALDIGNLVLNPKP